ncbi:hypothetical protein ACUH88_07300 [Dermabacteraceae bacterium P13095]
MRFQDMEALVRGGVGMPEGQLRERVRGTGVGDWDPAEFWDWKQENFGLFGDFIVRAVRSFDGGEDVRLVEALISNLHVTIPYYDENIAELSTLLLEEFVAKQLAQVSAVLDSAWDAFSGHPDFGGDGAEILSDLDAFRAALGALRFSYLERYQK